MDLSSIASRATAAGTLVLAAATFASVRSANRAARDCRAPRLALHPRLPPPDESRPDPASFRWLTRDLYVAPGDAGFWRGAFRDETDSQFEAARKVIEARSLMTVDLLYGDHEGGQRMIGRFPLRPHKDTSWWLTAARHWNVDRPDPR